MTFRTDHADSPILRFDRVAMDLGLRAPAMRPDGSLLCEGIVAREGILEYRDAQGGVRRELVTREALDSMAETLGRAPVTLEHPPEMVDPQNMARYVVGDVDGDVATVRQASGGYVRVQMAVRRADALEAVRAGKVELSPGYAVVLDETPGEHPTFGRYDAKQIGRTCNHLAIVDRARGGATVRLRADSADREMAGPLADSSIRFDSLEPHMKPLLVQLAALFGVTRTDSEDAVLGDLLATARTTKAKADRADAAEAQRDSEKARADAAEADKATLQGRLDAVTAERDAEKTRADGLAAEKATAATATEKTRLDGIAQALKVKVDGLDLPATRRAIAAAHLRVDAATLADKPDAYLDAVIDMAAKAAPSKGVDHTERFRGDGKSGGDRVDDWFNPYAPPTSAGQEA